MKQDVWVSKWIHLVRTRNRELTTVSFTRKIQLYSLNWHLKVRTTKQFCQCFLVFRTSKYHVSVSTLAKDAYLKLAKHRTNSCTCLLKTNKVHFSFLIYSKILYMFRTE